MTIKTEYEKLLAIKNEPNLVSSVRFWATGRDVSEVHKNQWDTVHKVFWHNVDAAIKYLLSGQLSTSDIMTLLSIASATGSVAQKDNLHMIDVYARLRKHREKLPKDFQDSLDWQMKVHGY